MGFFKKIYNRVAVKMYADGKQAYEDAVLKNLYHKGNIAGDTVFYTGAEIINLAEKKEKINIGHNCHISGMLLVYSYGGCIAMGDHCSVSPYSRIVSCDNITIGNRVLIAHNVNILDNISHPIDAALRHEDFISSYTTGMQPYDRKGSPIVIEDDVWIGFNAAILKGVTIGRGAIIGAGSVVTKDVKPYTINAGNPLRCIREIGPLPGQ